VIQPEAQVSDDGADDSAGNDVEASMLEIRVARRTDVQSEADWNQGENDTIGWGGGGLVTVFHSIITASAGESCRDGAVI